jgi:hypothetical protein
MPTNPQDILAFYEKFRGKLGWDSIEAMRIFVPQLFASRSFDGFHFCTSHEILCISHFANYSDREFAPLLSIGPHTTTETLRFEFTIHKPEPPIFRAFTEQVICPIEHGLEQFDDLFSRFRNAQKPK